MNKLSHIDEKGKLKMVDVSEKKDINRIAEASGFISLQEDTLMLIRENKIKKGDVLTVAEIAGIQAAKNTSQMIPLCHNLLLNKVDVKAEISKDGVSVKSSVKCFGKTGVEMEALTAVSVCLLTVYDMCKAVDKQMEIKDIKLDSKLKLD